MDFSLGETHQIFQSDGYEHGKTAKESNSRVILFQSFATPFFFLCLLSQGRLGSSVGITTGYGLDGARFSAPVQTGPGAHPASCTMGTGSFLGVKSGHCVTLTPHPLLVPWSWKGRAIPLLPLWPYGLYRASVPVQGRPLPLPLPCLKTWTSGLHKMFIILFCFFFFFYKSCSLIMGFLSRIIFISLKWNLHYSHICWNYNIFT